MSKTSNKRTFNTLHKNTSSLWNKRYKIAFGVAITLISLMALAAFVRSRMKEVGDKAKETIDETLKGKPEELIDSAVDKLLGLVGKKATKNGDGSYTIEKHVGKLDERLNAITEGLATSLKTNVSTASKQLVNDLEEFALKNTPLDESGNPRNTKIGTIVESLASVPTAKLKEFWAKLKDKTTGKDKKEFQTTITSFFKTVKESSKPLEEMAYDISNRAALGLRTGLPGFAGGITLDEHDRKIMKFDENVRVDVKKLIDSVKKFTNAYSINKTGYADTFINIYSKLKTEKKVNIVITGAKGEVITDTISVVIDLPPNENIMLPITELYKYINENMKDKLGKLSFGKRLKKRSKKRSSKRSMKKNKKY